jgi:lipoprotein-releasing system ATP-binding protein
MSSPVLRLRGVTRSYKSGDKTLEVLRGVDLDVMPGEIVGLVGPSGSGKSSLLHAAGLLEQPEHGELRIDGVDASKLDDRGRTALRRRAVGFVYQFHHLLPEFSAVDNVVLPQRLAGRAEKAAKERATALLTRLGLAERLDHQPGQLSGGEQQRVAVARALANAPRLLLADEPTGNLDPETSRSVFDALSDLARTTGVAAVIATHNLELAGFMDRVVAIKDGRLVEREPAKRSAAQ